MEETVRSFGSRRKLFVSWPASVTSMLSGSSLVLRVAGLAPVRQPRITEHWEEKLEGAKRGVH